MKLSNQYCQTLNAHDLEPKLYGENRQEIHFQKYRPIVDFEFRILIKKVYEDNTSKQLIKMLFLMRKTSNQ